MKYILFLFSILFLNSSLWAESGIKSADAGIQINIDSYKSNPNGGVFGKDHFRMNTDIYNDPYSTTDPFAGSDPFSMKLPSTVRYGKATSNTIIFGQPTCSPANPETCRTYMSCRSNGGFWIALDSSCNRVSCHIGTVPDASNPVKCNCINDRFSSVERGNFLQNCPSSCLASQNKSYSFATSGCICNEGYTIATNGNCVANQPPPPPPQETNDCWRELAEKVASCESASTSAVDKCDSSTNDSLRALQGLLVNTASTAKENCQQAATATSSGYYTVEDTRKQCDEQIESCKTSCTDTATYLNANKERLYNACRDRAFQQQVNSGPPLPQDRFNPMWDAENRSALESEFQSLLTRSNTSRTTCETGTAATNRENLSTAMNDMNTTSKNANQCVCQLGSSSSDCSKVAGPADCSSNPSLPGCKTLTANCFDPKNNLLKCICFRNPDSVECKGADFANNMKAADMDASGFAGPKGLDTRGNNSEVSGMASGKNTESVVNDDSKSADKSSGVQIDPSLLKGAADPVKSSLADTEPADKAPNGVAPVAAGAAGGGGRPQAGSNTAVSPFGVAPTEVGRKLGGLFDTAKSAIGGIFKKGSNNSGSGNDYREGSRSGHEGFDSKKFRPRGMVRGLASEEIFAGKHEDIWKVMNKQYKVQDQKDNFIFDVVEKKR